MMKRQRSVMMKRQACDDEETEGVMMNRQRSVMMNRQRSVMMKKQEWDDEETGV